MFTLQENGEEMKLTVVVQKARLRNTDLNLEKTFVFRLEVRTSDSPTIRVIHREDWQSAPVIELRNRLRSALELYQILRTIAHDSDYPQSVLNDVLLFGEQLKENIEHREERAANLPARRSRRRTEVERLRDGLTPYFERPYDRQS